MSTPSDRRRFLRGLLDDAARGARDVAPALKPLAPGLGPLGALISAGMAGESPVTERDLEDELELYALTARETDPAPPSTVCATPDELAAIAVEQGLGEERLADLHRLASRSARLTHAPAGGAAPPAVGASRIGGLPDLPADVRWPRWRDRHLPFLAQVDLAQVDAGDALRGLDGVLLFFSAMDPTPSGRLAEHRRSGRVIHVPRAELAPPDPDRPPRGPTVSAIARPLAVSHELVLPGVWSAPVVELGLDADERAAWDATRTALAERQGTEGDEASTGALALHRLLGHPLESDGSMPVVCELVAAGVDVGDAHPDWLPEAETLDEAAMPWRLLLQLSLDDEVDWTFGDGRQRLHFWIEDDALREGRFGRVLVLTE